MRERLNGLINRVRLVGIELEGGWDVTPDAPVVHDGSVEFDRAIHSDTTGDGARIYVSHLSGRRLTVEDAMALNNNFPRAGVGEIVSQPMIVGKWQCRMCNVSTDADKCEGCGQPSAYPDLERWVRKYYPPHVNHTCGLHVHMSFSHKLNYSRLMTPDFTPYMVSTLRKFGEKEGLLGDHPLWDRLNNKAHRHCSHQYLGDRQVLIKKKDYNSRGTDHSRYTAINYPEAMHKTVECRLLPMMDTADQGLRAIMAVLDGTNGFLSKMRQRERKLTFAVQERPEVFMEFGTTAS